MDFEKLVFRAKEHTELSSSGLNSSAGVSNHFGINVAQIRSKFLNFDLNALTCNSNFTVNKLLSSLSPEAQMSCSAVDAIVTVPKVEILCAFSKCVEIEGSGSLKFGTGRISFEQSSGISTELTKGFSTKVNLVFALLINQRKHHEIQ